MSTLRPPLELERPRDFSEILKTALALYGSQFGLLVAMAAAVVIPVDLIVQGVGMEQLWSAYDKTPPIADAVIPSLVSALVVTPLISAMVVLAMVDLSQGHQPTAGSSVQRGLDLFTPIFLALLLSLAGVTVGLILLLAPGVYLAIRWYFVTPSVVVDNARGSDALRRSGELVQGNWWRVLGILAGTGLVAAIPAAMIGIPFNTAADLADRSVLALAGTLIGQMLVAPFGALVMTLLYFDLRSRHGAAQIPYAVTGPPDPPGLPPT